MVNIMFVAAMASPSWAIAAVNEQDLRDAILGNKAFSEQELNEMDINLDGAVDIADLMYLLNQDNTDLPVGGYRWLVSASFNQGSGNVAPFSYSFVLDILPAPDIDPIPDVCDQLTTDNIAFTGTLREFDPTRPLLQQDLSGPGQTPGSFRPAYTPGRFIPEGVMFCKAEDADTLVLTSETVVKTADDPTNPSGVELTRQWSLEINKAALTANTFDHGVIEESLIGYLPGSEALLTSGTVFMVRYEPLDLGTVEEP